MSSPTLPPELNPRGPQPRRPRPARPDRSDRPSSAPGTGGGGSGLVGSLSGGRRRWPLVLAGVASAFVLLFSTVGSGLASYYESKTGRVDVISGGSSGPAQNYLLVGSDNRAGLSREQIARLHVGGASTANASGRRSDTMILLHLSAGDDKATLVSLPRDSYVTIPAYTDDHGTHHAASHNKLNAAYELGGAALTVKTVQLATGLHIDHYVEIGFGGFVNMVNALGGVPVCSTRPLKDPKSGLDLPAGTTKLDGRDALAYVRARYVDPTADLGRMKRQQAFLGSVFRTALSTQVMLNPVKLNAFLSATLQSVTLDRGLTRDDLLDLATRTRGLSPSNVVFATVPLSNVDYRPGGVGSSVLWDRTKAAALFAALKADRPVGGQTSGAKPVATGTPVAVAPSRITVQVENGAGVSGLGARAAADLQKMGFVLAGPATNAAVTGVTATRITYDPRWSSSIKTLLAAYPDAQATPVKGQGKVFVVVVGSSYQAPKPVRVVAATTTAPSANPGGVVTTNAATPVCKTS
jgi:LCP family protein required for cell wall assembly